MHWLLATLLSLLLDLLPSIAEGVPRLVAGVDALASCAKPHVVALTKPLLRLVALVAGVDALASCAPPSD